MAAGTKPKLGISSCLLGERVRYDGGHELNDYVTQTLAESFDFVPFCPEQAIGLPTPRNPIRLVAGSGGIRALEIQDPSRDYSEKLDHYAQSVAGTIGDFSGYIVKSGSPSCGLERVKVFERDDVAPQRRGTGLFTARLMAERPALPFEDEDSLSDPQRRENFVSRVYTMFRWQALIAEGLTKKGLLDFHSKHKFLIPDDQEGNRELDRLFSDIESMELARAESNYIFLLMQYLRKLPSD